MPNTCLRLLAVSLSLALAGSLHAADTVKSARALHDTFPVLDTHLDTPANLARQGWDITEHHHYEDDGTQVDYIRLRRYRPGGASGLSNTDFPGDVFDTGLFKTGVPYRVKVILLGTTIEMQVQNMENPQEQRSIKWDASIFPLCREGRVGLRHMFGRSARYKNFTVRQIAQKGSALLEE